MVHHYIKRELISVTMQTEKKKPEERVRNWVFIVYPESLPLNWRDVLDDYHVPWCESPLHDRDLNPDGDLKKPHIHVCLFFDGPKSYNQILEITNKVNGTIPQKIASAKGMIRYLVHLDNPEKAQYSFSDILCHSGFDYECYLKPNSQLRYEYIEAMQEWVDDSECTEFWMLFREAKTNHRDTWYPLLCDNSAFVMEKYISSRRNYFKEYLKEIRD